VRSSEPAVFKNRRCIREYTSIYQCRPSKFEQAFKQSDLVIIEGIEDLSSDDIENLFIESKARCIIIDSSTLPKDDLNKLVPNILKRLVSTTLLHSLKILHFVDYHDVTNGTDHKQYTTNTVILLSVTGLEQGKIFNLLQINRAERGVGVLFEKFVLNQLKSLKLKRVVHVNAKTLRWLKASSEYAPYVAQTVNPLLYRLMIDSEKLTTIRLSDEGIAHE